MSTTTQPEPPVPRLRSRLIAVAAFAATVKLLRGETGFKPEEIFRKYLRWCLDQRAFDPATVSDLLNLATCCVLTDDQVRVHTPLVPGSIVQG